VSDAYHVKGLGMQPLRLLRREVARNDARHDKASAIRRGRSRPCCWPVRTWRPGAPRRVGQGPARSASRRTLAFRAAAGTRMPGDAGRSCPDDQRPGPDGAATHPLSDRACLGSNQSIRGSPSGDLQRGTADRAGGVVTSKSRLADRSSPAARETGIVAAVPLPLRAARPNLGRARPVPDPPRTLGPEGISRVRALSRRPERCAR
jgi:hypothetical protein